MKIIAFGASFSSTSINKKLASYAAHQFEDADIEVLNLPDFSVPMFTVDIEAANGHPENAKKFITKLEEADLLIISMGEHNGSYQAAFKNLFDWASRIKAKTFGGTKMLLLSTSPGARGGLSVMDQALNRFPRHNAEILAHFSLPNFNDNFSKENGITNEELNQKFQTIIEQVKQEVYD